MKISEEVKRQYRNVQYLRIHGPSIDSMWADALRDMTARVLEYEHADHCETCFHWHGDEKKRCVKVNWTQADWEAEAEKVCRGEKALNINLGAACIAAELSEQGEAKNELYKLNCILIEQVRELEKEAEAHKADYQVLHERVLELGKERDELREQHKAELAVRDNQITQLLQTNDQHVIEIRRLQEDLSTAEKEIANRAHFEKSLQAENARLKAALADAGQEPRK